MALVEQSMAELRAHVAKPLEMLNLRSEEHQRLDGYYEGDCPLPRAIETARLTKAYRLLMPMAGAPWGSLVVDSVQDRLEVTGIRSADPDIDDLVWGVWQDNRMDAEAKLAHSAALISGRAFALVWPDDKGIPRISLDSSEQMIVRYREGSRHDRVSALRRWVDDDGRTNLTLYLPDRIVKLQQAPHAPPSTDALAFTAAEKWWEPRASEGDQWIIPNPLGVVPVVELAINRRLKPGSFGYARGEFEHCTALIDRINMLTFLGLVVAFWMGFPLRALIGDKILRDDENKPIAPFDANASGIIQIENPAGKIAQFDAADRKNLSIYAELDQLATITKTPRHYMPMESAMANLSADAIRASEGGLHAKVQGLHKPFLGEGWEEVLRLAGMMLDKPQALSPRAELLWADHESRSLAERADAASKLKDIMPWQVVAETALQATQEDIARWESMRTSDAFGALLTAAVAPVPAPTLPQGPGLPTPVPTRAPAANGNGRPA